MFAAIDWTGHMPQPVTCEEDDYCADCGKKLIWIDELGRNAKTLEERENRWKVVHSEDL